MMKDLSRRNHKIEQQLCERTKQLQIQSEIIQIGERNMNETKQLADNIEYDFSTFNQANLKEFTIYFLHQ